MADCQAQMVRPQQITAGRDRQHQQWSGHAGKVVMHGAMRNECTQRAHDVARLPGAGNSSSLDGDGDTALRIHATHGELQRNRRPHGRIFGN